MYVLQTIKVSRVSSVVKSTIISIVFFFYSNNYLELIRFFDVTASGLKFYFFDKK